MVESVTAQTWAAETWAEQTRRVLTSDLLVRARHTAPGEARALEFRALHLNLPLIGEVADELGLATDEREAVEHAALDGLLDAVRLYDPWGRRDFASFALPFVRAQMLAHRPSHRHSQRDKAAHRHTVRLVVRRAAHAMAGYHA
jgi:DNA-directed RNA polymerase specialized sigma subunit